MMSGLDLNPRSSHVAACDASGGYFSVGPAGTSETGRRSSHAAAAAPEVPHRGGGLMIINTLLSNGVSVVRPASRRGGYAKLNMELLVHKVIIVELSIKVCFPGC